MSSAEQSTRRWLRRVREIRDRKVRSEERVCFVEGIRQVIAAHEGGHPFEAVLVDASRLRSETAWHFIDQLQTTATPVLYLKPTEFERISSRDNPTGLAAIVRWGPIDLRFVESEPEGVYLATDDVRDPGNLGTLIRTADAFDIAGIIIHAGTDPGHPTALRASLGTTFRLPVYSVPTLKELFYWTESNGIATVATSARASEPIWQAALPLPCALLFGNEGEGLSDDTLDRCDRRMVIPMAGTASSLNVSVAVGIVLYEFQRRLRI